MITSNSNLPLVNATFSSAQRTLIHRLTLLHSLTDRSSGQSALNATLPPRKGTFFLPNQERRGRGVAMVITTFVPPPAPSVSVCYGLRRLVPVADDSCKQAAVKLRHFEANRAGRAR